MIVSCLGFYINQSQGWNLGCLLSFKVKTLKENFCKIMKPIEGNTTPGRFYGTQNTESKLSFSLETTSLQSQRTPGANQTYSATK